MISEIAWQVERSWAETPLELRAPYPEGGDEPFDYQHAGVEYALARPHAIIGDEPGLGKTCQAILISNFLKSSRTLIVCPASLRLNWVREIHKWSNLPTPIKIYPVLKSKDGTARGTSYLVVSYDLLRNKDLLKAILLEKWDHLILDEAHALKDPAGNKRTRAICAPDGLASQARRLTLLSGTLLPNQPVEVYNAMRLLDWSSIDNMSLAQFREYYYDIGSGFLRVGGKVKYVNNLRNVPRHLAELGERLRGHLMVRRLADDVLPQLPQARWHLFPLIADTNVRKALKHPGWKTVAKLYELDSDQFQRGIQIDGEVATARRELGEAKAPLVAAYVKELLDSGLKKIVVSAWHISVINILFKLLGPKYGTAVIHGGTIPAKKDEAVYAFQNDEEVSIIIGQMKVIGEGWNLTAAQDVVNAEPDWVPGANEQLIRRIRRIGQKGNNLIGHLPVVPGSLEERIVATAVKKDKVIHEVLDGRR
jgi:SWI/SNF-related matrix-associated actin-dependent regulator 1 of chromatin subfamily A